MSVLIQSKPLQTALDLVTNNSGVSSMSNLDLLLKANSLKDWTYDIESGTNYILPDGLEINKNRLQSIKGNFITEAIDKELVLQCSEFFTTLSDIWILSTGYWNDNAVWKDDKFWKD